MMPSDLVQYRDNKGVVRLAFLVRYLSARKAIIRLDGQDRSVHVSSLKGV